MGRRVVLGARDTVIVGTVEGEKAEVVIGFYCQLQLSTQ